MSKDLVKSKNEEIQSALIEIVKNKDIDPERLEKFLDLQIKMEERQSKMLFQSALAEFQGECPIIRKTKKTSFESKSGNTTKYNYSPLDEIIHVIKPILMKRGLSFSFDIRKTSEQNLNELITTISHKDGHSKEFTYFFNPLHDDARMNLSQRAKSALTYAKRSGLENALGLVSTDEDDDANRAIDLMATDEQMKAIEKLIKSTDSNKKLLEKHLGIESLESMSKLEATNVIHALKQKRINLNKEKV
jgi:hypothetical protein